MQDKFTDKSIQTQAANRRKKNNQKHKKKPLRVQYKWNNVIIAICIVSFAVYIGDSLIRKADRNKIETEYIGYGNVKSQIAKDMVIVRNSKVLLAPTDGNYELIYPEGTRLKKGQPVAKSKNQESIEDYNELINIIDSRISDMENPNVLIGESNDLSAINNKLEGLYRNVQTRIQSGDIKYIESLKRDINTLNDKKQLYFIDEEGTSKEKLLEKKNQLLQERSNKNSTVYTDTIGLVSSYYDGHETVLNILNMKNLSVAQLKKIENTDNINYAAPIKKGEPVATIVDNEKWYLLCEITKEDIDHIQSERAITIEIEDIVFIAYLEDFYKDKNGKFVGYFRVSDERFDYFEKRKFKANIVYQASTGIAIPNNAITEYEGQTGIFVVERTGVANFKPLEEIAAKDNQYTAIEYNVITDRKADTINIYDEVILNPKNIKEGDRIR